MVMELATPWNRPLSASLTASGARCRPCGVATSLGIERLSHTARSFAIGLPAGLLSAPVAVSRTESAMSIRDGRFLAGNAATRSCTMYYGRISRRLLRAKERSLNLPVDSPRKRSRSNGCCPERYREQIAHRREFVLAHPAA